MQPITVSITIAAMFAAQEASLLLTHTTGEIQTFVQVEAVPPQETDNSTLLAT